MSFKDVKGQPRALRRLQGLLKTGRVPSGLLFSGPDGVGKKKAALEFAKALGCEAGGFDACGECARCSAVDKGISPDVRLVDAVYQAHLSEKEPEKALEKQREWHVDTIREICREMQKRSFGGDWKAAIVDDADRMNVPAQNALLKMLEEPPERTLWILVAAQPAKLLPTIRSRVQSIPFGSLSEEALGPILETLGFGEETAAYRSAGSVQWALRERAGTEAFEGLSGPLAPFAAADALPRELASARPKVELALDHLASRFRKGWDEDPASVAKKLKRLERLRRWLRSNASPSLILELAFARNA